MIHDLKPYPAYKDSGIPWIGKVPEHWDVVPNRARLILKKKVVGTSSAKYTLLSLTKQGVIARDLENPEGKFPASFDTYQEVKSGDLIFCLFDIDETPRTVGLSTLEGMITGAYTVFECTDPEAARFIYLFYLAMDNGKHLKPLYTGLRKVITKSTFLSAKMPLPPSGEQSAIVRYLDHIDRHIRHYIREKKKLIKLLEEQKQAIIHQAVTRGLDSNVKLKPSGVEWLGEIPEHWAVIPNRYLFRETTRKYIGENEIQLSLSQREGLIETDQMKERSLRTASYDNFKVVIPDDLVLNRFKAHLGVFFASTLRGIVTFHYGVFYPLKEMKTKYFELLYHTNPYKTIYAGVSNGMTVGLQNLSNQNFYKIESIVPPLSEQIDILYFVEKETQTLDRAIDTILREISLLREYRTRLIADVVTGKMDVREAAANLPVKADETGIEDDFEEETTEESLEEFVTEEMVEGEARVSN